MMASLKKTLLSLLLIFMIMACNAKASLDFTSEDLVFSLFGNIWKLNGKYVFSNYSDEEIRQNIYFPIPVDSTASGAEDISIKLIRPLKGQSFKVLSNKANGFWFELTLPAMTIATCNIKYWQQLRGTKAKYILLTANSWGKPLEKAKYTLLVSNKIRIKKLPFPVQVFKQRMFHAKYIWEFTNFSPKTDFIVENKDFFYK